MRRGGVLSRGHVCPKDHRQHLELTRFYPPSAVARTQIVTIWTGTMRGGQRLPSSRELARELGVSRGMVREGYRQLPAEGYLTSRTGSATG